MLKRVQLRKSSQKLNFGISTQKVIIYSMYLDFLWTLFLFIFFFFIFLRKIYLFSILNFVASVHFVYLLLFEPSTFWKINHNCTKPSAFYVTFPNEGIVHDVRMICCKSDVDDIADSQLSALSLYIFFSFIFSENNMNDTCALCITSIVKSAPEMFNNYGNMIVPLVLVAMQSEG